MNIAIVVATAVLLIQGTRIVMRPGAPPFVRGFGFLTLLLGGLSFALFAILFWGEGALAPEFDVAMARGHGRGLVVLVIGFAVAAGLGLHVQRLKSDLPGRLAGLLVLGFVVGTAAATRVTRLGTGLGGEDSARAFWIYSYDLWWPPLLIWLSACFVDGAITILGVHDRRVRMGAFLAMLAALSLRARARPVFADPTSAFLWEVALGVAVIGGVLLAVRLAWSAPTRLRDSLPRLRAAARNAPLALRREWERAVTGGWPGIAGQVWQSLRPMVGQLLAVLALVMIALSLADIFYVGWLPQAAALIILAVAWTCLAEVTAQGPLRAFVVNVVPEVYQTLASQGSWVRQGCLLLSGRLAGPLRGLGAATRRLVSLRPFPEALMKIAVLFVILVVAYEIPHAGKTLLQPFTALAVSVKKDEVVPTASAQADMGRAVFDHLVNTLGTLTVELQPDVILLLPPDPERGARFRTLAAGGSGSIDPFLTQGTDIDVGGIKLPLGFVLTPVLQPIRWLLGVRVVNGSVLADPQGYTVLVRSSAGDMWRARLTNAEVAPAPGEGAPGRSAPDLAFNRLALELAFRIMSAEPALATFGMTRSWDAFGHFKRGLNSWQEFTLHRGLGDPDALSRAIRHFRAAIAIDPTFSLAHYRLGVALNNDGQPLAAAEALRASLKANPGFVPAMVALASVLYSPEPDPGGPLIGLPKRADGAALPTSLQEARRLWQAVINLEGKASSLDRAAAWAGLCRHALDEPGRWSRLSNTGATLGESDRKALVSYRIAYFYCQQAERLYAGLATTPREDLRVRTARASELASIGMLLERHGPSRESPTDPQAWHCSAATIAKEKLPSVVRRVTVSHYTNAALRYYRQALTLLPDDSVLRCHEAAAEFAASGRVALMKALESEAEPRWNLAESYRREAHRHLARATAQARSAGDHAGRPAPDRPDDAALAAAYFALALTEYRETLKRDPTNFEALNRYGHVFWEWRRGEAEGILTTGPRLEHGRLAESSSRRAIAMIEAKRVAPASQGRDADSDGPAGRPGPALALAPATLTDPPAEPPPATATSDPRDDSMPRHLRAAAATAYAGLGAVLLAQTRPHEALEVLASGHRHSPEHPSYDHVRWLLAQAHLCAASREFRRLRESVAREFGPGSGRRVRDVLEGDPRLEAIGSHRERARPLLDAIHAQERSRESPAFAGLTDISRSDSICRPQRGPTPAGTDWASAITEREGRRLYELKQDGARTYRGLCGWLGVEVNAPRDWAETEALYLHVWGGTVDERVPVRGHQRGGLGPRQELIPIAPTRQPLYYFAQLENADQQPVSLPIALEQTSAEEGSLASAPMVARPAGDAPRPRSESRCSNTKNLVQLTFNPAGSAPAPPALDD